MEQLRATQTLSSNHWDAWYSAHTESIPEGPSQFAVFTEQELVSCQISDIIEFGCGNCRDAKYFASRNFRVVATDKSGVAIANIINEATTPENLIALQIDAATANINWNSLKKIKFASLQAKALYGRFFLHTLTNDEIKLFALNVKKLISGGDLLFLEYRAPQDRFLEKITPSHYRNFVNPDFVIKTLAEVGLKNIYQVSGRGFAKWKDDDAFVTRQIFKYVD